MKKAFTLVELLVVVLIIGILTAVAIPMYQSAVDKTHWSTLLPTARALKNAEEAYLMATNVYTDNEDALDVAATQGDATYELQMPGSDSLYAIRATTPKLPTVRLAQYLDDNAMRAGQLYCEASDGADGRGTKLCEKLLNGQELGTTDDGYTQYLLDQEADKITCGGINRSWSTSKTKCYKTTAERCEALGMPAIAGEDTCGYVNGGGKTIPEEGVCQVQGEVTGHGWNSCNKTTIMNGGTCIVSAGSTGGCWGVTVKAGGTCISIGKNGCGDRGISGLYSTYEEGSMAICLGEGCGSRTTYDGAVCVGNAVGSCSSSTFKNDAICYANVSGACRKNAGVEDIKYETGGCCCGNYCGTAPKCADSRCDPYYMDPNNFKDL